MCIGENEHIESARQQVRIKDLVRGVQQFFSRYLPMAWSAGVRMKQAYISGARGPGNSCIFKSQICILPLFLVPFLQNFQLIIYVGT